MTEPPPHPPFTASPDPDREAVRAAARELAAACAARGEPLAWFEQLYAGGDARDVPWFDGTPHPLVASWPGLEALAAGTRALVVGCGLGDDAELLAARGADVTAFDLSASAVAWCRRRFPRSPVCYAVADLLAPPARWRRAHDLVVEVFTLQAMPPEVRARAFGPLADLVAPGGRLLVVTRLREDHDPPGELPYPLTRGEIAALARDGLQLVQLEEEELEDEAFPVRARVTYRRADEEAAS